jgi:hypothetical protein
MIIVMASDRQYTQDKHWKREPTFPKHLQFGKRSVALFLNQLQSAYRRPTSGRASALGNPRVI